MGGHRAAIRLRHLLGVAVVGGDHGDAAHLQCGVHHPAHAAVYGLHGLHRRVIDAGVAHHVAVGKVQNDHVIGAGLDALHALVRHLRRAHLRLLIVGGHLGGGHQYPVLTGKHSLGPAVEEEGHMGVLLRLRDPQLGHAHLAEILPQAIAHRHPGEGHLHIGHGGVVLCVAHEGHGEKLAGEAVELRVHQGPGDLPGPVGPEVEEDHAVIVGDGALGITDHGFHEFVGDAPVIGLPYRGHRVWILHGALAVHHGVVSRLHPVPALVPVHGIVPAHDRGDLAHADLPALCHGLRHKVCAGGGGYIPPIQKGVEIHMLQAPSLRQPQQGEQVLQVGVDAAVGQQAHQVQGGALLQAGVHGVPVGGIFIKAPVGNGLGDPGQVLEHHPAGADVGVAHLAVAHLPVRQAHVQAGGPERGVGILPEKLVQPGRGGGADGVALRLLPQAEAVHDDEGCWCFVH